MLCLVTATVSDEQGEGEVSGGDTVSDCVQRERERGVGGGESGWMVCETTIRSATPDARALRCIHHENLYHG